MSVVIQTPGANDVWTDVLNFPNSFTATVNADLSVTLSVSMLKLAASAPTASTSPGNPNEYWVDASGFYYYQVSGASTGWRKIASSTF